MKMDYSQLSIYKPNSGYSPAELEGTGDPDGTSTGAFYVNNQIKNIFYAANF
jgi:hypothetical protein